MTLVVKLRPMTCPRPRGSSGRRSYLPADYQAWQETAQALLRQAMGRHSVRVPTGTPVAVTVAVARDGFVIETRSLGGLLPLPPNPAGVARSGLRGDLDNYVKAILDAANGVVWDDDRQVVWLSAWFMDGTIERMTS